MKAEDAVPGPVAARPARAEVMRWAIGRIRENPACTQVQDRAREISELKAQF